MNLKKKTNGFVKCMRYNMSDTILIKKLKWNYKVKVSKINMQDVIVIFRTHWQHSIVGLQIVYVE